MPSSGNATRTAPRAAASLASSIVCAALNVGSATLQAGTPTATRAKSWLYRLKKFLFMVDMDVRVLQRKVSSIIASRLLPERRMRFEFLDMLIHCLRLGIEKLGDRVRETLVGDPVSGPCRRRQE